MENSVNITLKPYLRAFLCREFNAEGGFVKINRHNSIGRLIYSLIHLCNKPDYRQPSKNDVTIILPEVRRFHPERGFLYLPQFAQDCIEDHIEAYFDMRFYNFMNNSVNCKVKQEDSIQYFLTAHKLKEDLISMDALKKKYYRFRRKNTEFVTGMLQRSVI